MNKIRCIFIEKIPTFPLKKDLEYQVLELPKLNNSEWQVFNDDSVYHINKSQFVPIIEAHWSTNNSDTHNQDDADSTCFVLLESGDRILFNTFDEAKNYIQGRGKE
ncbi:MAG: hypothetical protein WC784_01865 [Candidatus Shapirobacteria bacterium]|jgi:hypothetical protein